MTTPSQSSVIVVVGGTTGIGRAVVDSLFDDGHRLVVVGKEDPSIPPLADKLGDQGSVIVGDVTESILFDELIGLATDLHGTIDGWLHVAGGSGRAYGDGPLHTVSDMGITYTLDLNLHAVLRSNRAILDYWTREGRGGSIVLIGSVLAQSPAPEFFSTHVYATAKAGLEGLTRALAAYYADQDIRVNLVAPGLIDTPMAQRAIESPAISDYVARRQRLGGGRAGLPSDLVGLVRLLLDDAGRFITGQIIQVDGGWSVVDASRPVLRPEGS